MKNNFFAALLLTAATIAPIVSLAPTAHAAESKAAQNIQSTRLEFLNNQTKSVKDIQSTRLDFLNNQTKSVKDVQATRLGFSQQPN